MISLAPAHDLRAICTSAHVLGQILQGRLPLAVGIALERFGDLLGPFVFAGLQFGFLYGLNVGVRFDRAGL